MRRMVATWGGIALAVLAVSTVASRTASAQDATPPKFSPFASAEDLSGELTFLVADLEKAVEDQAAFDEQIEKRFIRDSNTVALLATALALHDQDNAIKPHAQAIIAAADKLREAKDYAVTKKAVGDLKASLQGSAGGEVKWRKISPFKSLMNEEVTGVNGRLKSGVQRLKDPKLVAANAATMALIAENAKLYLGETKKPTEGAQWAAFADQLRGAAVELAAKARAGDKDGAKAAFGKMGQSCDDCHAVFNPEKAPGAANGH